MCEYYTSLPSKASERLAEVYRGIVFSLYSVFGFLNGYHEMMRWKKDIRQYDYINALIIFVIHYVLYKSIDISHFISYERVNYAVYFTVN